ncbi:MarR family transcriptional regulator [Limibacter armeniacum]|uniref:MarR family winged helix-turn-helix transcriptional regulator n=1 Tax=Limibacter armeniacum TaxID=466084 RepID=UPI002FE59BD8
MERTLDEWMTFIAQRQKHSLPRLLALLRKDMEQKFTEKMLARGYNDFKMGHIVLLVNIDPDGTINNELARLAKITKQGMNKVVKILESAGYIYTEPHQTDKRAILLKLTDKGKQKRLDLYHCHVEIRKEYEEVVGQDDIDHMLRTLRKLLGYHEDQI